jgi:hypothetical protein
MSNEEEERKAPGPTNPDDGSAAGVPTPLSGASISGEIVLPDDDGEAESDAEAQSEPPETRDDDPDPGDSNAVLQASAEHPIEADEPAAHSGHGHGHGHHGPLPGEKKHYFDYPENVTKLLRWFYIGCGLLVAVEIANRVTHALYHPHPAFPEGTAFADGGFEEVIPAFYCMYGFVACTLLVIAATQLRKVLMRREDYYDV